MTGDYSHLVEEIAGLVMVCAIYSVIVLATKQVQALIVVVLVLVLLQLS